MRNHTLTDRKNKSLCLVNVSFWESVNHQFITNPVSLKSDDLDLMRRIDKIHTDFPIYGTRKISAQLTADVGYSIGRKRTRRLMKLMGIEALYPKPKLSFNNKPHLIFPYLLNDLVIVKPNQVWSADITYIRMKDGFLYLVVFMDWFSRYILSWRLSGSLKTEFCLEAAYEALKINIPNIINVDQGVQFTDKKMIAIWQNYNRPIA